MNTSECATFLTQLVEFLTEKYYVDMNFDSADRPDHYLVESMLSELHLHTKTCPKCREMLRRLDKSYSKSRYDVSLFTHTRESFREWALQGVVSYVWQVSTEWAPESINCDVAYSSLIFEEKEAAREHIEDCPTCQAWATRYLEFFSQTYVGKELEEILDARVMG